MNELKKYVKKSREQEIHTSLMTALESLETEGLMVEFGKIGIRTTYALIHDADHDKEIIGFTFLKDLKFNNEELGRLKALNQALARKKLAESRD